jgi:ubiquitin
MLMKMTHSQVDCLDGVDATLGGPYTLKGDKYEESWLPLCTQTTVANREMRLPALRRNYHAMRDMYLSEPAPCDDILAALADLESRT